MSYLLFVRSSSALDRACREVSEFLAYQRLQGSPAIHTLHGVWIGCGDLPPIASMLESASRHACDQGIAIVNSVGVSGIWELARLQVQADVTADAVFPERLVEALRGLAAGVEGLFAPVFAGGTSRSDLREELSRLRTRYPGGIAAPLVQEPESGALFPVPED